MGNYTIFQMFENPRRGRQARSFTRNVPKILDLKSSSEQVFSENCRWVPLINLSFFNRPQQVFQGSNPILPLSIQSGVPLIEVFNNRNQPNTIYVKCPFSLIEVSAEQGFIIKRTRTTTWNLPGPSGTWDCIDIVYLSHPSPLLCGG